MTSLRRFLVLAVLAAVTAAAGVAFSTAGPAGANLNSQISGAANRAEALRAAVSAETRRIRASASSLRVARSRLSKLQSANATQQAELKRVERALVRARDRLTLLIDRQRRATDALRDNLVSAYREPDPDIVSVVLTAKGFADLLERADFLKRIARQNARIMDTARTSKTQVARLTSKLATMQIRQQRIARELERKHDRALAIQTALLRAQQERLSSRSTKSSQLRRIQNGLAALRRKLARTARAGIATNPGGQAQPPPGAPPAVGLVMAAGNAIAGLPYLYGGGHAGFKDTAYDCSGSISYALAAAGLVTAPMTSGGFMSWGESGPGKWITIYTNPGHMFMVIAGWRFDTTALRGGGTRWTRAMRPTGGLLARHPPGL